MNLVTMKFVDVQVTREPTKDEEDECYASFFQRRFCNEQQDTYHKKVRARSNSQNKEQKELYDEIEVERTKISSLRQNIRQAISSA